MKEKSGNISRRKFIEGVGATVAATYASASQLKAAGKKLPKEIKDSIEGKVDLKISVNGKNYSRKISPETTLLQFIRDELGLTGTKLVCNNGECGGCSVLMNDKVIYSCHLLALDADGSEITTIEGLGDLENLNQIQKAFIKHDGLQCGFCTPGQIIAAEALLRENPNPSEDEIKEGLSGNLCRCSAYPNILKSVKSIKN